MIAALRYRRIPYAIHWGSHRNAPAGYPEPKVKLLPTVYFPNGNSFEAVTDSSPIIRRLEREVPGRALIPADPVLAFLDLLIEDYADEWLTKCMFHFRWAHQADIDNAVFASAVDRVATISAEKSRSVKLAFELDRVTLTVRNMEAGQGVEEVEIGYSEAPFEIGFNARYLLDVAGQITGENATFLFADPASPTLVLDPGDPGVQYVLMPLRV
jgi:hypothetical protein